MRHFQRKLVCELVVVHCSFGGWPVVVGCSGCVGVVWRTPDSVFVCFYACFLFLSVFGWDCWLAWFVWLVVGFDVFVLFGEFDPGSGRTLAACCTCKSGAEDLALGWMSGERVRVTRE